MSDMLSAESIIVHLSNSIDLEWVAGEEDPGKPIHQVDLSEHATLIGHLNLVRKNTIQVLGSTECNYLDNLDENMLFGTLVQLFSGETIAIIVADDIDPPEQLISFADKHNVPLMKTNASSVDVVDDARYHLDDLFAEKQIIHGVFMEVFGTGTLITGESSLGKSELALELITRGHRLIADDAPEFTRISPDKLDGRSPGLLKNFMEVRGLGILNIRDMYGDNALKENQILSLIIRMKRLNAKQRSELDRLDTYHEKASILGIEMPVTLIPVEPGRNIAVMVEAAVRNFMLRAHGHDATEQFIRMQQEAILDNSRR